MSGPERYGNRKMPKIIREWRGLADACRAEGTPSIQAALDRVEPVIDAAFQGDAALRAARENALREAADFIRRDQFDASVQLDPKRHASLRDWIREQQAAGILALIDGEKP